MDDMERKKVEFTNEFLKAMINVSQAKAEAEAEKPMTPEDIKKELDERLFNDLFSEDNLQNRILKQVVALFEPYGISKMDAFKLTLQMGAIIAENDIRMDDIDDGE